MSEQPFVFYTGWITDITGRFWWVQSNASVFRRETTGYSGTTSTDPSYICPPETKLKLKRIVHNSHTWQYRWCPMYSEAFNLASTNCYIIKAEPHCGRNVHLVAVSIICIAKGQRGHERLSHLNLYPGSIMVEWKENDELDLYG